MIALDKNKLEPYLRAKGMNLSKFAQECGVSRQSIYNMFSGKSIFSTSFEKVLEELKVDFSDIVTQLSDLESILQEAPHKIKKVVLRLQEYAKANDADLFLIGSRARGKLDIRRDWDFALYFRQGERPSGFSLFKQDLVDYAFPHRLDLVCLNDAPAWFLNSIKDSALRITGLFPDSLKLKESV